MMSAEDVCSVLDSLASAGADVWLDGGWGVDALLGEHTREHDDLDMVIPSQQVEAAITSLAALGFEIAEDLRPARLVLSAPGGRKLDFHPVVLDSDGNGRQFGAGPGGGDALYPAAGFTGLGKIAGRAVQCLTPALLVLHHRGYEPMPKDRHNVTKLCERFAIPLPPEYK